MKKFNDPGQTFHKPKTVGPRPGGPLPPVEDEGIKIIDVEPPLPPPPHEFALIPEGSLHDEIRSREIILVGPEGLAIDRKTYRDKWEEKIIRLKESDPAIEKIFLGEELTEDEWEDLLRRLNSPEYFFNEDSLRRAFQQPTGSLTDFIRVALGLDKFLTREERIEKAFNTWVAEHSSSINPAQAQMLRLLKARVVTGEEINVRLFSQPPFSLWGGLTRMEQLFGKEKLIKMVEELNLLLAA